MTESVVFDIAGVMRRLDRDDALFRELVEVFREEHPKLDAALERAMEAQDSEAVTLHAHSLKGALGNVGAARASAAAKLLEVAGRSSDTAKFAALAAALRAEISTYLDELAKQGY